VIAQPSEMIVESPNEMTSSPTATIEQMKPATACPLSGTVGW
jgi:hypothetical protein